MSQKKAKNSHFIQFYYHYLAKPKTGPMNPINISSSIQNPRILILGNIWKAHDSNPWQKYFINGIQIHNESPRFKPMTIYLSKPQFSLAISKAHLMLALFVIPQFDWLCDVCGCVMSHTSSIYWVNLGFINNYKEPQLWLVLLRYSAYVANAFPWVVTYGIRAGPVIPCGLRDTTPQSGP